MRLQAAIAALACLMASTSEAQDRAPLQGDAQAMLDLIERRYAYPERLDHARLERFASADALAGVTSETALLDFAECALHTLEDHHAIMGVSSARSYVLMPSHGDLWVVHADGRYVISDVRTGSPAAEAGLRPGGQLIAIGEAPVEDAVAGLCGGPFSTDAGLGFAARMLAAGRRDRVRALTVRDADGSDQTFELDNLYTRSPPRPDQLVTADLLDDGILILRIHDSLSADGFVEAVDAALADAGPAGVVIDLRDTPSGGNTINARGLLGRFVDEVRPYQRHHLTAEARATGVGRQWVEEVLPRGDSLAHAPVVVLVGRWTGSMGEGLAMGFDHAAGATIVGAPMAGLLGAIYDFTLPHTSWTVKLPAERMSHVDGTPREDFRPAILLDSAETWPGEPADTALDVAVSALRAARG